jgi:hypothetical protein
MFSAIRKRLTYANVAMTLALVFAMSGGAYAANKFLITSTKQISPKVLKALKGKPGAAGPAGLAGATGAAGAQGPAGAAGAQGPAGPAGVGKEGEKGKEGTPGTPGAKGVEGSPWTELGTLPSGKSLKGEWSIIAAHVNGAGAEDGTSVSFALPLSAEPRVGKVHYINEHEKEWTINGTTHEPEEVTPAAGCTGNVAEPGAEAGNLCVFAKRESNAGHSEIGPGVALPLINAWEHPSIQQTASPFGFGILTLSEKEGEVVLDGTWAVTAE